MRGVARRIAIIGIGFAVAVGALWHLLRPPHVAVPSDSVSLLDVTIVDPGQSRRTVRQLQVRRGRIVGLGQGGFAPRPDLYDPEAATHDVSRYAGAFVLPGLIDMHVHQPPDTPFGDVELASLLFLVHGVTSVRDTGSFDGSIFETRREIREGAFPGPRIFACGPILDGEPPFWPGSRVVRDAGEARAAVDELAAAKVDCIKVYERVSAETLAAVHEAAARHGLPVIGHVPDAVRFSDARLADVQHLTGLVDRGEELTQERVRAIVTASAALGIAHTPTLVFLERVSQLTDYRHELADPAARLLPRYYREVLWNPDHDARLRGLSPADRGALRESLASAKRVVKALHDAGVEIHVGTDAMNPFVVPGASLHEEMWELVDAGLTPEQVWIAATRTAGKALDQPLLGTIRMGAPADLLVFREDPTRDLNALQTLEAVIAAGRLYPRETLQEGVARWKSHFDDPVYDALTMRLARWLIPAPAPAR
ncbi:MAG: amidohydrolase family protein [Thermodesulfobacteriota bacterium]